MALVLDAIEAAVDVAPRVHRHRLEHAGYPRPDQIARIARLGVITVNQPSYLRDSGDDFLARLDERAHHLQPLKDELDAGVAVVLSSGSTSPAALNIYSAAITDEHCRERQSGRTRH